MKKSKDNYRFEMTYIWDLQKVRGYMQSWSAVQKFRETNGYDPTEEIIAQLSKTWTAPQTVRFPVFLRLGKIKPEVGN